METRSGAPLIKLSHADLAIDDPRDDIRGRHVVTVDGETIGLVDDLLIDGQRSKVRFLEVGSGGFLGIGTHRSLNPIEAVVGVDEQHVRIDQSRDHVAAAPLYHPHIVPADPYFNDIYDHYGFPPPPIPGAESG